MNKRQSVGLMTAGCFFSYFLFGFVDNLRGLTLPFLLDEIGFSNQAGGAIVLGEYLGFVLATLAAGVVIDLWGRKTVMATAGICLFMGVWGYATSAVFARFAVSFALVGVGCGAIELGGSNIVAHLYGDRRGRMLNLLTCMHGVGSLLAPLFAGAVLRLDGTWREAYLWALAPIGMYILYFLLMPTPETGYHEKEGLRLSEIGCVALDGPMPWLYVFLFAYVAAEIGMSTWLGAYLNRHFGVDDVSLPMAAYFGCFLVGRLLGSVLVDRVGYVRIMTASVVGALGCIAMGVLAPWPWGGVLPLVGLFYAVIFPTATALATRSGASGTVLGLLFCCGGVGGMLGPWLIGVGADSWSLPVGMLVNALFCVLMLACLFRLRRWES